MRLVPEKVKHWPLFWDGLIAAFAIVLAGGAIVLPYPANAFLCVLLALHLYCCFVEPWIIVVKTIPLVSKIKGPLRIAFVSDFHVGPHKGRGFMCRIADRTNALKPDIILLGGDFLYNYKSDPRLLEPLCSLTAPLGVYAVMGNHDSGRFVLGDIIEMTEDRTKDVEDVLSAGGITVLHNEWKEIKTQAGSFVLAGTEDPWMLTYDLGKTLEGIPADAPVLLLTHNPDATMDERSLRADLVLSGHTHGGQMRLPFFGSIAPIPTIRGRAYDRGTFHLEKETTLIISHGVGESTARPRFFTVPEILCIELAAIA